MDNALALSYTGAWRDPVVDGLPLGNGYRTYLPDLMRFTAPDHLSPFGKGGVNPYAYCSGDPINFSDPSGQFQLSWTSVLGLFAAFFGVGLAVFTGGSSLAIASAILGVASAATGIAADNTEGTAHDVLMGISVASAMASFVDAEGITQLGKTAIHALTDVGKDARAVENIAKNVHVGRIDIEGKKLVVGMDPRDAPSTSGRDGPSTSGAAGGESRQPVPLGEPPGTAVNQEWMNEARDLASDDLLDSVFVQARLSESQTRYLSDAYTGRTPNINLPDNLTNFPFAWNHMRLLLSNRNPGRLTVADWPYVLTRYNNGVHAIQIAKYFDTNQHYIRMILDGYEEMGVYVRQASRGAASRATVQFP